ncbi:MAG: hypothetical protein QOH85_471 [Acidobacteriaceae bacterium]|jgi:hypothetical protein|nr:hypothetical protein [Acidobacteriaceae bacterium]
MRELSPCIKRNLYRAAGVLLLPLAANTVSAQVAPPVKYGPAISVFGTLTEAKPDFGFYNDLPVYGFTVGGFTDTPRLMGYEWRGSMFRTGGVLHQETALAGVRFAVHSKRFSPYLSVLGGGSHSWYMTNFPHKNLPKPVLKVGTGLEWSAVSGVDVYMTRTISLRVGELSYGNVFVGTRTLTSLTASAGVVYRPRARASF